MSRPESLPAASAPQADLPFDCALSHSGRGAAWIRLSGELDLSNAPRLTGCLDDAFASARLVVVDLRHLTFMDSCGLGVLTRAHVRAHASERRLVLIRGPRQVDRLLEITGLDERLEITDLLSVQPPVFSIDKPHVA